MDRAAGHDARLSQRLLRAAGRSAARSVTREGLAGLCPWDDVRQVPGDVHAGVRSAQAPSSWSIAFATLTAVPDGCWRRAFQSTGRTANSAGYVGCDIDITERKNADDRIRASQAALEASHQEIKSLAGRGDRGAGGRAGAESRATCTTTWPSHNWRGFNRLPWSRPAAGRVSGQ